MTVPGQDLKGIMTTVSDKKSLHIMGCSQKWVFCRKSPSQNLGVTRERRCVWGKLALSFVAVHVLMLCRYCRCCWFIGPKYAESAICSRGKLTCQEISKLRVWYRRYPPVNWRRCWKPTRTIMYPWESMGFHHVSVWKNPRVFPHRFIKAPGRSTTSSTIKSISSKMTPREIERKTPMNWI